MGYRLKAEASCPKLYQGSMQSETGALVTKVTQLTVKLETKACVYEAKEIKPAAEVFDGEKKLTEDTDYILQYLDNKKAGEAKVIVQGTGRYEGSEGTAIFTIQPRPVTVTGATVEDKKYDGTVTANVTGVTLDGILSEDSVSYQAQGTFTDAQPGTEKTVEITVALTGNDKGNYTLTGSPFVAKASIYRVVSDTPAKEPELSKKEQEQVEKLEATKPKEQEPEATKNTVKLTWEKIKNADGYAIYRYDPDTGKYVLIKKTEKTSFTDKNLKTATGYQYKIKAYKKVGTKTVYSKGKKITAATTVPVPQNAQIKKVSGNSSRTKAELSWKKAAKADGYYIYEYKASKHKFQLIGKIKDGKQYRYNAKKKTWHFERKVSQNGNRIVYRMKDLNFTKERMYQYRVRSYIRYNKTSIKSKATPVLRLQR